MGNQEAAKEDHKGLRKVTCVSAWHPSKVMSSVARASQSTSLFLPRILLDAPTSSTASVNSSSAGLLHCTPFLFDDKLLIVKRPGNSEKGGRALAGLGELDRLAKTGGRPSGKKKSGMTCKGVVDVTEVVATDIGGAGKIHFPSVFESKADLARHQLVLGESSRRPE
jgi:hypothetical protein